MNHLVYTDSKADELTKLLNGTKTMIVRGATGRKLPYGQVDEGDQLYFIHNHTAGTVCAKAAVKHVFQSDNLSEEASRHLVHELQAQLQLTPEQYVRWGSKHYLVFIEIEAIEAIEPFEVDYHPSGTMDDWLVIEDIEAVKRL
jgi:hypothetical protein